MWGHKPSNQRLTIGPWAPEFGNELCDIPVVSKRNEEYLDIHLDEVEKPIHARVIVSPNWEERLDALVFLVRELKFPEAQPKFSHPSWETAAEVLLNFSHTATRDFSAWTPMLKLLEAFKGNRVAEYRKFFVHLNDEVYVQLLGSRGLGASWVHDSFRCSPPSVVPVREGLGCLHSLGTRLGGAEVFGEKLWALLGELNIIARSLESCDSIQARIVLSAFLTSAGRYWHFACNFQLACLYYHRSIEAILQVIALELDLVEWGAGGVICFRENSRLKKFSVGSGANLIKNSGRLIGIGRLIQQVLEFNDRRNSSVLGHGTGGLLKSDSDLGYALNVELMGKLPKESSGRWRSICSKLVFETPVSTRICPFMIEDLDSGFLIKYSQR